MMTVCPLGGKRLAWFELRRYRCDDSKPSTLAHHLHLARHQTDVADVLPARVKMHFPHYDAILKGVVDRILLYPRRP
jgi:hypothetical protein